MQTTRKLKRLPKRILSFLLTAVMVLTLLPMAAVPVWAEGAVTYGNGAGTDWFTWDADSGTLTVLDTSGTILWRNNAEVAIAPADILILNLTPEIMIAGISGQPGAFEGCTGLTSVTLPTLESIGTDAFKDCTSLTSVTFAGVVNEFGTSPFSGCTRIETVTFESTFTAEVPSVFAGLTSLTTVGISGSTSINQNAFKGCTGLETVTLGNSVATISSNAFEGCTSLTSIDLSNATYILGNAFKDCTGLTGVDLSVATTVVGTAFTGCTGLTSAVLNGGKSITAVASNASHGTVNIRPTAKNKLAIIATPQSGYSFVNWTGAGGSNGTIDSDVTAATTYTAGTATSVALTANFDTATGVTGLTNVETDFSYDGTGASLTSTSLSSSTGNSSLSNAKVIRVGNTTPNSSVTIDVTGLTSLTQIVVGTSDTDSSSVTITGNASNDIQLKLASSSTSESSLTIGGATITSYKGNASPKLLSGTVSWANSTFTSASNMKVAKGTTVTLSGVTMTVSGTADPFAHVYWAPGAVIAITGVADSDEYPVVTVNSAGTDVWTPTALSVVNLADTSAITLPVNKTLRVGSSTAANAVVFTATVAPPTITIGSSGAKCTVSAATSSNVIATIGASVATAGMEVDMTHANIANTSYVIIGKEGCKATVIVGTTFTAGTVGTSKPIVTKNAPTQIAGNTFAKMDVVAFQTSGAPVINGLTIRHNSGSFVQAAISNNGKDVVVTAATSITLTKADATIENITVGAGVTTAAVVVNASQH